MQIKHSIKPLATITVALLLVSTSHNAWAQCSTNVYVRPTTTDCSCGGMLGYTCDAGGDQINAYNACGSSTSGGTNCISQDSVIGVTKTCTSHYDIVAAVACAATATECLGYALSGEWEEYAMCLVEEGVDCVFCGQILTCSESDTDIHGQIYVSTTGTCPIPPPPNG